MGFWFVDKNWRPWAYRFQALGLSVTVCASGGGGLAGSHADGCSWPPALRAGPAVLEVGTAAAAHRAVFPGGLCPLRGLHPCV